jgi:predicted nucleic acid-binding protein
LIERLAPALLIPNAVLKEVRAGQQKDPTAATALTWAEHYAVDDMALMATIERWDLGSGEAQVIAHSIGGRRWAVLDDLLARRCALAHDVPVIGSLGIVLRAKKHRIIAEVRPMIKDLVAAGMFLDDELANRVLAIVGE